MNQPQGGVSESYNETVHPGKKYNRTYKKEALYYCENCGNVWQTWKESSDGGYTEHWEYCAKNFPFAQKPKVNCPYCKDEDLDI